MTFDAFARDALKATLTELECKYAPRPANWSAANPYEHTFRISTQEVVDTFDRLYPKTFLSEAERRRARESHIRLSQRFWWAPQAQPEGIDNGNEAGQLFDKHYPPQAL